MKQAMLVGLGISVVLAGAIATAQQGPTSATYITKEQIDAVNAAPGTDRQLRVLDMGKYQLAVGIIHRGPTGGAARGGGAGGAAAAGGGAARGGAAAGTASGAGTGSAAGGAGAGGRGAAGGAGGTAQAAAQAVPCGTQGTPSANGVPGGIAHDATTETYIIVSGSGTLVTGGHIVNGRRSAPESEVTRVLNGPSCSGAIDGPDVVKRQVKTGDVIIIPAGVPHGWTDITDHVDYLSVRPDPDKVLAKDYTHPAMPKQ